MSEQSKSCFVISPIGEEGSETRKRADQILKHVIRPAVEQRGYAAFRADEIDKPGIITSQVIQRIVADPLVVADLTERNPNVFYELAVRHASRKPIVQLIQTGHQIPFDVANTRTIQVDHHDLDSVENAKKAIITQVDSLQDDPGDLETPISVSLDLQVLRQSERPEDRSLADLVSVVAELRTGLAKIDSILGGEREQEGLHGLRKQLDRLVHLIHDTSPRSVLATRGFHPGLLHHLAFEVTAGNRAAAVLVAASVFRDSMPWVYQLGVEVYHALRAGTRDARELLDNFAQTIDRIVHNRALANIFQLNQEALRSLDSILSEVRRVPPSALKRNRASRRPSQS